MKDNNICWYTEDCPDYPKGCVGRCEKFGKLHALWKAANLPPSMWNTKTLTPTSEDLNAFERLEAIRNDIEAWVRNGSNLYLYSKNYGNGKTTWAIKLLHAYIDTKVDKFNFQWPSHPAIFVSVPIFLSKNKEMMNIPDNNFAMMKEDLRKAELVVWDDIATSVLSDYDYSIILGVLEQRILSCKANIFTGNADADNVVKFLGGRLSSRIWNGSEVVKFVSEDNRGAK